jgi:2-methylcitrate dehydratase PrpD
MSITRTLAVHAVGTRFEDLPAAAVRATKNHILYTTGTILAGAHSPGIAQLLAAIEQFGEGRQSSVLVHGKKLPAASAALVNAAMAHSRELDINDDRIAYKSSVAVVPAAWAMAQKLGSVSGREFITAVCVGIDLGIRLGLAIQPKPAHARFIALGPIAAAAACARLMKLDAEATHDALGIAYCRSTVSGNSLTSPSLTKRLGAGLASQSGIVAATFAQAGFPATTEIFAGPEGFFQTFYQQEGDHQTLLAGLGRHFEIVSVGPKPFPSCRYTHAGVCAALDLRTRHDLQAGDIAEVRVHVGERDLRMVWGAGEEERRRRAAPQGVVDAQFSIPYTIAAALVRGGLTLDEFTPESFVAPDILELAGRIHPVLAPEFDTWPSDVRPQLVELVLRDGRVLRERVDHPRGSPENPFTDAEVEQSVRVMAVHARTVGAGAVETFIESMRNLEACANVAGVIEAFGT